MSAEPPAPEPAPEPTSNPSVAAPLFELLEHLASNASYTTNPQARDTTMRSLAAVSDRFGEIGRILQMIGDGLVLLAEATWSVGSGEVEPEVAMEQAAHTLATMRDLDLPETAWELIDVW